MSGTTPLSNSMLELIFRHGIRNIDRSIFFKILKQLEDPELQHRDIILHGLPNVADPDLLNIILQSLLLENGEKIEDFTINFDETDRRYLLQSIISSDPNRIDMVIEFLTNNFDKMMKM